MGDKISDLFNDLSEAARIRYWIAHNTDLSFDDIAALKNDLQNINRTDPDLVDSTFELEAALKAYFQQLIGLQKTGSVSVKLDRQNIAAGYAYFVGFERNLFNYNGDRIYHASPERLAERYQRLALRARTEGNTKMVRLFNHIADELRFVMIAELNRDEGGLNEDKEVDLEVYHYLVYCLEGNDPRMSTIARYLLETLFKVKGASGVHRGKNAAENAHRISADIYERKLLAYDPFSKDVFYQLPSLELWRDSGPQRIGHERRMAREANNGMPFPAEGTLLLAFNREYELFEAFLNFFNELSVFNYFAAQVKDIEDMPELDKLLEEVVDQVLFSRLTGPDRALIINGLKMMRDGLVAEGRSELDDDIKHRLDSAAWLILNSIKKEWGPGAAPQTPRETAGSGGGNVGRGPLMYHAPWMGMVPAMQAGATVFTAARPMPLLGMPLAMPVTPF